MGEKLILAVSEHPVIYDRSFEGYRDRIIKNTAWRKVSETTGLPVEECRRNWRDLRDVYVREKREEKRKRANGDSSHKRPWRYCQIMSFLLPFITSRVTSSNMKEDGREGDGERKNRGAIKRDEEEKREGEKEKEREGLSREEEKRQVEQVACDVVEGESTVVEAQEPRAMRRRVENNSLSPFERRIVGAIEAAASLTTPTPADPDQQFLNSLVPALQRLDPQRKALVKLKIHQLIYEAEFSCNTNDVLPMGRIFGKPEVVADFFFAIASDNM
ncbi:hypothetical protein SKAU_G00082130 [Synaphobranchus kaupii]|uniref:Transcription factor Adf-1 n=1 Tax=Synaphobranchus kaupii TaxID=118154 RepID=A0A9Q1FVV9_SYNKA|nr:hypothetical protein SKAU_G00082130 [Synaphobranchus kaupii]